MQLQLLLISVGLVGFASRLIPQIRARRRSKTAERIMAQKLWVAVRNHNVHRPMAQVEEEGIGLVPRRELRKFAGSEALTTGCDWGGSRS